MRPLSWLLIAAGLLLTGYGAYDYYLSQQGQEEARQEWASGELPVPATPPARALHYFNPYKLGDPVAKLKVPRLATTLYVVEGTDLKDLEKGPGHMPGTALPGVTGNCVIAGHRDTHFRLLEQIHEGDEVELDTHYGNFRYRVRSMEVVSPDDVASLQPTNNGVLHLITCYPFHYVGHAPKRMVIEAELERAGAAESASRALASTSVAP